MALAPYRKLFWLMVVYCLAIQVGSVLLGWHYAIDGYFGALLALGIYFGTRPFFRISDQGEIWSERQCSSRPTELMN